MTDQDLPDPVCPYAKSVALKPFHALSRIPLPTSLNTFFYGKGKKYKWLEINQYSQELHCCEASLGLGEGITEGQIDMSIKIVI